MNRLIIAASLLLATAVAAFAQGAASDRQLPKPGGQGAPPGQRPPAGGGTSIEQSVSQKAQLNTIAFSGLAFMTGTFGADTFLPPGKAADYFGFQYMRDIDAAEAGHNQMFLTNIGNNVLAILSSEQKARLLALVLIKAFRRAETCGAVAAALTAAQKAAMAKLKFGDSATWPELPDQFDKRTMSHEEDVLFMTYASEFFSWYAGSVDADAYFCPERHATYFGGFCRKDYPAMNNRDYFIPTTLAGDSGEEFFATLSDAQRAEVVGIMDTLPGLLRSIVDLRRTISTELRKFLAGGTADRSSVLRLSRTCGELGGEISWQCATRFAAAYRTLTVAQKAAFVKLRNQDVFPKGVDLSSTEIALPAIADTVFLFAK